MKKRLLGFLSILFLTLAVFSNVNAKSISKAGETVNEKGEYASSRFIAGNRVSSDAKIDGISFAAGNYVSIGSSANYGFYAGNSINFKGSVDKDLFIAGNDLTIEKEAEIGRDAYLVGSSIKIYANIPGDLRCGGNVVDLSGTTVGGNAYVSAETILLDKDTVIEGTLSYPKEARIDNLKKASIGSTKIIESTDFSTEKTFKTKSVEFIISVISAFVTMAVVFLIRPKAKEKLNGLDLSFNSIIKMIGIGFATLILVPCVAVALMITGCLIPLAFIILAIYIISIYIANIAAYYVVGHVICSKLFKLENAYLSLIVGIILVKLIKFIPYLGGLVGIIALFYGLGLIFMYIKNREN